MGVRFNPAPPDLWRCHAVVSGKSSRYRIDPVEGTLSLKTVIDGEACWTTERASFVVSPETYLILNHGQTYRLEIDSHQEAHTFCVFFQPGYMEALYAELGLRGNLAFFERLNVTDKSVSSAVKELHASLGDPLAEDEALNDLALRLIQGECETINAMRPDSLARQDAIQRMSRARDFALSNLSRRYGLDELADRAHMSSFHFHRLHKELFGETPHEFVSRARFSRARRLLKSQVEVAEIALELGYESVQSFTRLFRAREGCSPGQFRKIG